MTRWADFEEAAPAVAGAGRERIDPYGFVLLGTIRRDGTPRISPVEVFFVEGELTIVMMEGTHKLRDVRREARVALTAPVTSQQQGAEFKVRGRLVEADGELRAATADAMDARDGWRPREHWPVCALDVEDAAFISWEKGVATIHRWSRDGGLAQFRRAIRDY